MTSQLATVVEIMLTIIVSIALRVVRAFKSEEVIPKLVCRESALTKHLIKRRGLLSKPFKLTWLIRNRHTQTIIGYFMTPIFEVNFEREYVMMCNKGCVALDWYLTSSHKLRRRCPLIVILPRLTGDARSVGHVCKLAASRGLRPVVFNRRGHGSSLLTSPKLTSTGDVSDFKQVLEYLQYKHPFVPMVAIGFGAGSATLFSYLGEFGSSSLLKAAVCISPSYDNTENLCKQIPRFYELLLLIHLKRMLLSYSSALHKIIDTKAAILKSWTLKEFDYHVYCKVYGFETFETYWKKNDPMRDVDEISVPVLCINSLDDPVSTKDNIPFDLFRFYINLLLVTVDKGGHCAFHEDFWSVSWAVTMAVNYLEGVLEFVWSSRLSVK